MENYPIVRLCSFYLIVHKMHIRIIREKSQRHNGLVYMIDRMKDQNIFAHVNLLKGERSELSELASNLL